MHIINKFLKKKKIVIILMCLIYWSLKMDVYKGKGCI